MLEGTFDFAVTGVLASLAAPLARAGIPIVAISTFDTDYVFVRRNLTSFGPSARCARRGTGSRADKV